MVKPLLAVVFAVIGALWVWMTAVPFSVHRLVNVVNCVSLAVVALALSVMLADTELLSPVPVGPTRLDEFALDVKVVNCVSDAVVEAVIGSTTEEFEAVAEAVALALTEIPLEGYVELDPVPSGRLEFELGDEVIGAECLVSGAEVIGDEDPVMELTTDELVRFALVAELIDKELELAPVLRGTVELELKLELVLAETDALKLAVVVIGAECVCVTAVPFSVHRLVKVV
ncbi:hypothetical protein LTR85_011848 [Meristemomyces frigidus]|nr:hypothetical protein LTR85_011848 [Meristemomyces frigidus]